MTMPQTPLALWAEVPFSSSGEMIEAMGNPLYKNSGMPGSAAFVAAVEAKIAISDGIGTGSVNIGRVASRVVMGAIGDEGPSLEQQGESFRDVISRAEVREGYGTSFGSAPSQE